MHRSVFPAFGVFLFFLSFAANAQTSCESCSLSFVADSLAPVEISCSEGDPLQALPNFPAFNSNCTEGYWASIFKYTTASSSTCNGVRPTGLPVALGTVQLGEFTATGLTPSNHFNDLGVPLTWTVYPENVARLQGTVYNNSDINAHFEVDFYFSQSVSGAEWLAGGGNVNDAVAGPDDINDWTIWQLRPNISKLIGGGTLAGHTLHLSGSNSLQSYPFQVGSGANGVNASLGLGGAFDWQACVSGTIYGGLGISAMEFSDCEEISSACASDNDAVVEFFVGNLLGFDQIQGAVDVTDDTPPVLQDLPNDYTLNCPLELEELDALNTVTAADDCSTASLTMTETFTNGDCPSEFARTRVYTATDGCGLTMQHTQTVQVIDEVAPSLSVPSNAVFSCDEGPTFAPATASDACDGILEVVESDPVTEEGDCPGEYTIYRTFSTSDLCGNVSTGAQTIFVQDQTPPNLIMPADVILPCGSNFVYPQATATDNCTDEDDISIFVFNSLPPTTCPQESILERRFLATDLCGNSVLEIQTVTVTDNEAPYFTFVPEDATYACDETPLFESPTAADDCSSFEVTTSTDTVMLNCESNYDLIRTFTVSDACGNTTDAQQVISIRDNEAPVILSEFDNVDSIECDQIWSPDALDALDNCSSVNWEMGIDTLGDPSSGWFQLDVLHTASDACGNASSLAQIVQFLDATPPAFSFVPADLTISCEQDIPFEAAVAIDNCSSVTLAVSDEWTLEVTQGVHVLTRTFSATDAQGNMSEAVQIITIVDSTAPEFTTVPADYTVECSDDMPMDDATASDNCGEVTIDVSSETTAGDAAGNYVIVRTFTATDDAGNSASATQTITVQDTTAPEFTSVPADYAVECSDDMPMDDATASDNCGEVTIDVSSETTAGDAAGNYVIVRTFTATDDAGNSASATQTITVQDTTAPEFTSVPADYTVECSDDMPMDDATASDNCGEVTVEVSSETTAGDAAGNYVIVRTFTATDDAGNSSSTTQTITVQDTTAPEFTSVPADYTVECSDDMPMDDATASDNCGEVTVEVSSETTAGDAAGNYVIVRTFTATDDAGNSASATQTITVQDTTAPEFTSVPADYTVECSDDIPMDDATASDNCGEVTIDVSSETTAGDAAGNYVIVRTFTATDDAGNSASATQTITVQDSTAPEFTSVPADYTVECSDDMPMDDATASDNCGEVTIDVSSETTAGDAAGNYVIVRTFTATDDAGNSSSTTQTITVQDTTAPEFTSVPADYTVECSDDMPMDDATASDNCGEVTVEVSSETTAGDAAGNYVIVRTFTATDDAGNSASATQTITVQDTTAPEFTSVPADYTVECSDDIPMDDATASDNCGEVTIDVSSETTAGDAAGNYVIVRTFTATDDAGNSASATQTITVQDSTAPEFTSVPADYTVECSDDMPMDDATASDNCGEVTIDVSSETTAGDAAGNYVIVRTFTATDDAGNSSSATQTITVQDTTAPEFTFVPAHEIVECTDSWPDDMAVASDACGPVDMLVVTDTLPGFCGLVILERTFIATDDAGNAAQVVQTLTQVDTQGPVFVDLIEEVDLSCSQNFNQIPIPSVTDACSEVVTMVWNDVEFSGGCTLPVSALIRTYTAVDACNNVSQAEQVIQLTDNEAPEWNFLPEDVTLECTETYELEPPTATDNCAMPQVTWLVDTVGEVSTGVYDLVFAFQAVDDCDNLTEHEHVVHVEDTVHPEWVTFPPDGIMACGEALDDSMPTALDACSEEVTVDLVDEVFTEGDCLGSGFWTRTFTATDWNGNVLESVQIIDVVDTVAPVFTFVPPSETVQCDEDLPSTMAEASDACGTADVTLIEAVIEGVNDNNFQVIRTFTATDACGNQTEATQVVTVEDTTPPAFISMWSNETRQCGEDLSPLPIEAMDACSDSVTVSSFDAITPGACEGEATVARTYVIADLSGNTDSMLVIIDVVDTLAPIWTYAPMDTLMACDALLPEDQAEALDGCSDVEVTLETDTILEGPLGNYTLVQTWTAEDACDNTSFTSRIVQVVDTVPPNVIAPEDITVACNEEIPFAEPVISDNCGAISWSHTDEYAPGTCAGSATITRTYTVTDDADNVTEDVQVISIVDTVAPVFTFVPEAAIWECNGPAMLDSAAAVDACSEVTLSASLDTLNGLGANQWTLLVTWEARDECDNVSFETQEITVLDQLAPAIESGPSGTSLAWGDSLLLELWESELVFSDNCTDAGDLMVSVLVDTLDAMEPCVDELVLTWTVQDLAGNQESWIQPVQLFDNEAPVWSADPEALVLSCDSIWEPIAPTWTDDNDYTITETLDTLLGNCPAAMTLTWTLVAEDVCGNVSVPWVQTVSVIDTVAPVIDSWPADLVLTDPADVPDCELNALIWTDNCSDAAVGCATDTIEEFCPGSFLLERTYTVSDACGNAASAQQSILVEDVEGPVFEDLPNELYYACDTTLSPPSIGDLTITDNESTMEDILADVLELESEGNGCSSFTTFRYTAMDGCGNMTEEFYVQIREDNNAPFLTTALEDLEFNCLSEVPSFDDQVFLLDVEDCQSPADDPGYDVGLVATAVDEFEGGECTGPDCLLTRTVTVDDNCGNVAMFEQIIVISEPPTVPELPTGFSPNNDSFNDVYQIRNAGPDLGIPPCDWLENTTFTVFDRWGSVVFLSYDISESWDGTNLNGRPLPVGTYFVVFEANGFTYRQTVDLRR